MALGRTRDSLAGCECDHHRILRTPAWASQCMEPLPGAAVRSGRGCQPQCSVGPALLEIFSPTGPPEAVLSASVTQRRTPDWTGRGRISPLGPPPKTQRACSSALPPLAFACCRQKCLPTHQPALLSSPVPGGVVGCSDLTFGLGHVPTPLSKAGPLLVCGTEH